MNISVVDAMASCGIINFSPVVQMAFIQMSFNENEYSTKSVAEYVISSFNCDCFTGIDFDLLVNAICHLITTSSEQITCSDIVQHAYFNMYYRRHPVSAQEILSFQMRVLDIMENNDQYFMDNKVNVGASGLENAQLVSLDPSSNSACTICMSDFEADEKVVILPCRHQFHFNGSEMCSGVKAWLADNKTCPTCRNTVSFSPLPPLPPPPPPVPATFNAANVLPEEP
jgi:hypothetical protein